MRSHDVWQLRIEVNALQNAEQQQETEQKCGKTGIVHGSVPLGAVKTRIGGKERSDKWFAAWCAQEVLVFWERRGKIAADVAENDGRIRNTE